MHNVLLGNTSNDTCSMVHATCTMLLQPIGKDVHNSLPLIFFTIAITSMCTDSMQPHKTPMQISLQLYVCKWY